MKYRPSPRFLGIVLPAVTLAVALWYGVLPDLEEARGLQQPGEIVLAKERPPAEGADGVRKTAEASAVTENRTLMLEDLFGDGWDRVMAWEHNPWRRGQRFPDHFLRMLGSKDPKEVAKAKDIQRRVDLWLERLIRERFPELDVPRHPVADERNGLVKWLELAERIKAEKPGQIQSLMLGDELGGYLTGKQPWNPQAAQAWLSANAGLMDEIRSMGLLPGASTEGLDVNRYSFIPARLAMDCANVLLMEARLAIDSGDVPAAMEAIRAARGLGEHLADVESPTLLGITVRSLMHMSLEERVFSEILPALPEGSRDPAAWEEVIRPQVRGPTELSRAMKGEWSNAMRQWILPPLLDHEETKGPPDAGDLVDAYSMPFVKLARTHDGARPGDDPPNRFEQDIHTEGLSRVSRQLVEMFTVGGSKWGEGFSRATSFHGLTAAAFSVMKDDSSIPVDPVRGLPYRWDPATRTLSMPSSPEFDKMEIKAVVVPRR